MVKKFFSSKILKLTTYILSGILCMGYLNSNNISATRTEYKKTTGCKDVDSKKTHIRFNTLGHICNGTLTRDKNGNAIFESGGHLFNRKKIDEKCLNNRNTKKAVLEHLKNKTYFSQNIDQDKVKDIVNSALNRLDGSSVLKRLKENLKRNVDVVNYFFRVNMRRNSLGSNGETILKLGIKKDSEGLYCASAFPVHFSNQIIIATIYV